MKRVYTKVHPLFYIAAVVILAAAVKMSVKVVNPILLAIFFSIIIYHPIDWLKKKGVNGVLSIIIVIVGLLIIFASLGSAVTRSLVEFSHNLPEYKKQLHEITNSSVSYFNDLGINVSQDAVTGSFSASNTFGYASRLIAGIGNLLSQIVLLFLVAAFILGETNSYPIKLKLVLDDPDVSLGNITVITKNIRYYLGIKTITGLIGGTLVTIVLLIMGVQYALIWGIFVLLMRYIPNIGSVIAAIPIMLFVLIQKGVSGVIYAGIAYAAINFIIGQIIEPKFFSRSMNLSTLAVFLSLVFWGYILGDAGMLLAVPITMALKISLETRESTKWLAVMLGSEKSAKQELENQDRDENS